MKTCGRILIVNDDAAVMEEMKTLLENEGFEVAVSSTLFTIPFLLRRVDPDIILLDIALRALPVEALLRLDRSRTFPTSASIILCGNGDRKELKRLTQAVDADGFHHRDKSPEQFLYDVKAWVRVRRMRDTADQARMARA